MTAGIRPAILSAALACAACSGGPPKDIVVITLDTVRADRLGCYGAPSGLTPHIDTFARTATRFADASCSVPLTLPSHATLFTGRYPDATGVRNNGTFVVPESETTLAERLAARGFRTGAVIAAFPLQSRYGLAQGFDVYDDELPAAPPEAGRAFSVHFAERDASAVTDRALAVWSRLGGAPRFLWVHYFDAHAPYAPPASWTGAPGRAPYDREVAYVDSEVGRLLDRIDRDAPHAIVVIAADHGESLGEHGEKTHGVFLYQSTVRVPLLIRAPGRWHDGAAIAAPVTLADVTPTILGLAGLPAATPVDGADLRPLVEGGAPPAREVYAESYLPFLQFRFSPLTMLRAGALKYIDAPAPELYDLSTDPLEVTNLTGRTPAESAIARDLAGRLARADPEAESRAAGSLDEEAESRLRSLGYASAGTSVGRRGGRARDPKTMTAYLETYDRAVGLVAAGRIDEGLALLRALEPQAPENFMGRYQIAAALMASRRFEEAARELDRVVEEAPEFGSARLMRAECLAEAGRLEDAVSSFEEAARLMPRQAAPKLAEGRALETRGRFEAAAAAYREAAEREPSSTEAVRALVALRAGRGDLARAVAEIDALRNAHPRSASLQTAYADVLHRAGDAGRAATELRRALELDPDRIDALLLQAALLVDGGRPAEAVPVYRRVLQRRKELPAAMWGLARALVLAGPDDEAEAALSALEAVHPRSAQGAALRGLFFERRGDAEAAARAYENALLRDPGNAIARRGLDRVSGRGARP